MFLTPVEIQRTRATVATAFPRFAQWEWVNEVNDDYAGFCIWGHYTADPTEASSPRLFVTFDTFREHWRGHLTIGRHCYFWSSADVGDAHVLDTEQCATVEEAIRALKRRIASLVAALAG
jgi:hypothetical protein